MKNTFFTLLLVCFIFTASKCDDTTISAIEEDQRALTTLKQTIEDLVNTSVCHENVPCKFIAFGSKACGGPKRYLIYSTSIDVEKLELLVAAYNQKDADYNTKYGIISDCAFVNPPTSLSCENNICIALY